MKRFWHKYLTLPLALPLALLLLAGCLSGCGRATTTNGSAATAVETAAATATGLTSLTVEYSEADLAGTWDAAAATRIALADSGSTSDGGGVTVVGSTVTIAAAGTYVLSGSLNHGQIVVQAGDGDKVQLVLAGAAITNPDGPAILCLSGDKTTLTLADGTKNQVSDGSSYDLAEGEDEPNGAIFSKTDLTVNGSGDLTVDGNYQNGIVAKDDLVITGGHITVTAINDAVKGRDSVAVKDGTFSLSTKSGDGIQSSNDEDPAKGWIAIDGGSFTIQSGGDGVQAESLLQVDGGSLRVTAADDAIHANTNLRISAGEISLTAGDDGAHADGSLLLAGGSVLVSKSYEGIEASAITVSGGTVDVTAEDDGFNAAGGSDGSAQQGGAPDSFAADSNVLIRISGGSILVNAGGDGIDSNGSLYFKGGQVVVHGPTGNGNGPLDYNGDCQVTGGTLAIAGSSGMAQSPSDSSSQCSVTVLFTTAQAAGSTAVLADGNGKEVLSYTGDKTYQAIVFSNPDLVQGQTYTLLVDGRKLTEVTPTSVVTRIADDGSAAAATMGGHVGGSKHQPPDGSQPPDKKPDMQSDAKPDQL